MGIIEDRSETNPVRRKEDFIVFGQPLIGDMEIEEVVSCLKSGWLGTGRKVAQFEEDFKNYRQAPFAIAVNSCTAALHLSFLAAGLEPGDEVITSAMTFCATVNAIIHCGATPILADCDPETFCILPEAIKERITPNTKAIVPVHFAGIACDMDEIMAIAGEHKLQVIEDCAHAIETAYKGRPIGTFGDFGCFSFYVTKNVVTGEGGMVLCKQKENAEKVKTLALHGMSKDAWHRFSDEQYKHYVVVESGFKYNMMDLQAAIGIHQLRSVNQNWEKRKQIWETYQKMLADLPLKLPVSPPSYVKHAYHLFTVLVDKEVCGISRDEFLGRVTTENIGIGVHYQSIPSHPFYQEKFHWNPRNYPNSLRIGEQTVSLPLSAKLTEKDVNDIIKAVHKILG